MHETEKYEDFPPSLHSIGADLSFCIDPNGDACLYGQPTSANYGAVIYFNGELVMPMMMFLVYQADLAVAVCLLKEAPL